MSVNIVLLVLALVSFILAAFNLGNGKINFVGLGLAFWVLTFVLGSS